MVLVLVKVDKVVKKETIYISVFVVIFSMLMQAIFLILHSYEIAKWDYTALLGNVWGAAIAVGNFFAMALYVQKAVNKEPDEAKKTIKASQSIRYAILLLLTCVGVALPWFHWATVLAPLLFPSFAIFMRPLFNKKAQ